jgi:hypothetical protein
MAVWLSCLVESASVCESREALPDVYHIGATCTLVRLTMAPATQL